MHMAYEGRIFRDENHFCNSEQSLESLYVFGTPNALVNPIWAATISYTVTRVAVCIEHAQKQQE